MCTRTVLRNTFCALATIVFAISLSRAGFTEPQPGEIYKEYSLVLSGESWRVTDPNTTYGPPATNFLPNPTIVFNSIDLSLATKAELVIDKWGGHLGTENKRFRFNGNDSIMVPELSTTPTSSQCYLQEPNVTIDIPLSHLVSGTNTLQGSCDNQSCYYFNWGQWGWYAMTLRIYYDASKPHPTGSITAPTSSSTFGDNPAITATASGAAGVAKVEFLGYYDGPDFDGDGVYKEWHRSYRKGSTALDLGNHLGTATTSPYTVTWNTEWLPDQTAGSVKVMARVQDNDGVWYVMPIVDNLTFQRASGSVRLYKPFNVPENFWARASLTKFCNFKIPTQDSTAIALAARMVLRTWNGVDGDGDIHWYKANDYTIPDYIGANHQYAMNEVDLPVSALKTGVNKFSVYANTTGTHGIEIMWPGPSFLVKYQNAIPPPPASSATITSDEFNSPSLNAGIWEFIDYVGDATQGMSGTQLTLSVPAGTSHDIYSNQNLAPRALQYITDIQTFDVEAKFDALLNSEYQLNGLLVEQDATNLLRFDFYTNGINTIVDAISITNGTASVRISSQIGGTNMSPLYLQVSRNANSWTMKYSTDGTAWTTAGTFTHDLVASAIGPFAGNAGGSPPAFTGLIDYFRNLGDVPVQLAGFTGRVQGINQIRLDWMTLSETNNFGFEVQKSFGNADNYQTIPNSFIAGHGTSLDPHQYTFTDVVTANGTWYYRLKQIDLDGSINYSEGIQVSTLTGVNERQRPTEFALGQNYPNPFNPTTKIEYALPKDANLKIEVFNTLGQLLLTLVDARQSMGYHTVEFNANGLGSGIYFYKMTTSEMSFTKKMMLVR